MSKIGNISFVIAAIGFLTALTNIIVEVLKKITWDKLPTNIVALLVGEALCMLTGILYAQYNSIAINWQYIAVLFVGGFLVAYAAMFGFDKLKEVLNWNKPSKQ